MLSKELMLANGEVSFVHNGLRGCAGDESLLGLPRSRSVVVVCSSGLPSEKMTQKHSVDTNKHFGRCPKIFKGKATTTVLNAL